MTAFPKYPKYKDSGVEWLGEVPEHWEVSRNLGIFDERKEANQPNAELLSVTQDRGIIRQSEITAKKDSSNDDKSKYKAVRVGDLAYNKMRAWQGALGVSEFEGIVSPAYIVLTPRNPKLARFFHYLYRTPSFITEANRLSYGLCDDMNSLRYEDFKTSYSPIPKDAEIDRIVAFLDEKTAQIDALIAKKQRQIELLDEQKAILINRAVTRGLHPNPDLQDSGIPWIGPIPKGWKVIKFRRLLAAIEQGASPNAVQDNFDPNQWKVITLSAVKQGVFYPEAFKPISPSTEGKFSNTLRVGDFLLTRANTRTLVGDVCIVEGVLANTTFSDLVYRLRFNQPNKAQYLKCFLLSRAARCQIERDARGSNETMVKISHGHINEWDVVLPSESEMDDVVAHTAALENSTSVAIRALESQIQTLQTLRSTLIAHAVTGKIKV